jgi:hypothetical protein
LFQVKPLTYNFIYYHLALVLPIALGYSDRVKHRHLRMLI